MSQKDLLWSTLTHLNLLLGFHCARPGAPADLAPMAAITHLKVEGVPLASPHSNYLVTSCLTPRKASSRDLPAS